VAFLLLIVPIGLARGQGGAGLGVRVAEFSAELADGILRVGVDCSDRTPCNVRSGNLVRSFKRPSMIRASGPTSGPVLVYIDSSGNLAAGSKVNLGCEGCVYVAGATQFPPDSLPLFTCTIAAGAFQATGCTDLRAIFSTAGIVSGTGVLIAGKPGSATVSIDPTLVSLHVLTVPKMSHETCSAGQFSFDDDYYYVCIAANTWKRFGLSSF
jgi:hypothetical protein